MLIKLRPGVNFIYVLHASFTCAHPKSAKKTVKLSIFFALLGSALVKGAHKMLMKLRPEVQNPQSWEPNGCPPNNCSSSDHREMQPEIRGDKSFPWKYEKVTIQIIRDILGEGGQNFVTQTFFAYWNTVYNGFGKQKVLFERLVLKRHFLTSSFHISKHTYL